MTIGGKYPKQSSGGMTRFNGKGRKRREEAAKELEGSGSENYENEHAEEVEQGEQKGIVEVENPNRQIETASNESEESLEKKPQELNRKEREALRQKQARENYMKLTMEGKTDQAKSDLARLAIIRKQREEAAAKKKAELEGNLD